MAAFIQRAEGVYASHHYVVKLWRKNGLKPHRAGMFKVSKILRLLQRSPTLWATSIA